MRLLFIPFAALLARQAESFLPLPVADCRAGSSVRFAIPRAYSC